MRIVPVFVLALLSTAPAHADPSCLAAPTQDCVFQMARTQAKAEENPAAVATGLIVTAVLQEAAGRADWSDTLDDLPPAIAKAEPDLEKAQHALGFGIFAVLVSDHFGADPPLHLGPGVLRHLTDLTARIDPPSPEKAAKIKMRWLGRDGDLAAIEARLSDVAGAERPALAQAAVGGLIGSGRIDEAFGLLRLVPSATLSHDIARAAIRHVLRTDGPSAALTLSRRFADRQDRAEARITIAAHLAQRGRLDTALEVLADATVTSRAFIGMDYHDSLAETLARAGQTESALRMVGLSKTLNPRSGAARVQIIAAAVSGDFALLFPLIDQAESFQHDLLLSDAIQARWHAAGRQGVNQLLALMPKADQPAALAALGQAQVEAQDMAAAQETEARLAALAHSGEALKTLWRPLAPFFARQGKAAEAVAMAHALGHPWATAHVAAALDPIATD